MKQQKTFKTSNKIPFGRFIRAPKVLCIDKDGNNLGIMDTASALKLAENSSLELVQIAVDKDNVPICKILDFGKYKFEQSKKQKEDAKKKRETAIKLKEIVIRPSTGDNDLKIKADKILEFLHDGDRVKITVKFKGREMQHQEVGQEALNVLFEFLGGAFEILDAPKFYGKDMCVIIGRAKYDNKK